MDRKGVNTVEGKAYVYTGEFSAYGRGLLPKSILQNWARQHVLTCQNRLLNNQTGKSEGTLKSVDSHLSIMLNQSMEHAYEKYEFENWIGEGAKGSVYEARHPRLGKVAIKQFSIRHMQDTSECFKERDLLVYLKHERVIPIIGAFYHDQTPFLILERCKKSFDLIQDIPEFDLVRYAQQLLEGLQFIHGKGIMHCDIKLGNLLINNKNNLVICDFGGAVCLKKGEDSYYSDRLVGNSAFSDYDVLDKLLYTSGNDIFAAGCMLFAISSKQHLMYYAGVEDRNIYKDTIKRGYMLNFNGKIPSRYYSHERQPLTDRAAESSLGKLIQLMIITKTADRPSASDLLKSEELKKLKQFYKVGQDINKTCAKPTHEYSGTNRRMHFISNEISTDSEESDLLNLVFSTFYYDSKESECFDMTNMSSSKVFTQKSAGNKSRGESSAELVCDSDCKDEAAKTEIEELNNIVVERDLKMKKWPKMTGKKEEEKPYTVKTDEELLKQQIKSSSVIETSHDEGQDLVENSTSNVIVKESSKIKASIVKCSRTTTRKRAAQDSNLQNSDSDAISTKQEVSKKTRKLRDLIEPEQKNNNFSKSSSSELISSKKSEKKAITKVVNIVSKSKKFQCKYCRKVFRDKGKCRAHVKACQLRGKKT